MAQGCGLDQAAGQEELRTSIHFTWSACYSYFSTNCVATTDSRGSLLHAADSPRHSGGHGAADTPACHFCSLLGGDQLPEQPPPRGALELAPVIAAATFLSLKNSCRQTEITPPNALSEQRLPCLALFAATCLCCGTERWSAPHPLTLTHARMTVASRCLATITAPARIATQDLSFPHIYHL